MSQKKKEQVRVISPDKQINKLSKSEVVHQGDDIPQSEAAFSERADNENNTVKMSGADVEYATPYTETEKVHS